jgi:hypothetical protein
MNVLTDLLREIRQKKKKEVSRALVDRLFFFFFFTWVSWWRDFYVWSWSRIFFCSFHITTSHAEQILFRLESWFDVKKRRTRTFLFNSRQLSIDNHHWRILNADSSTRLSLWNRFYHWCYVNRQYICDDTASVKKWNRIWFVRERDNFIFFINKESKDIIVTYSLWHDHEESMKSRKHQKNLLNMSWWFYFTMKELYDDL